MRWFGQGRAEFRVETIAGPIKKIYTLSVPVSMPADEIEGLMILVGMIEPREELKSAAGGMVFTGR